MNITDRQQQRPSQVTLRKIDAIFTFYFPLVRIKNTQTLEYFIGAQAKLLIYYAKLFKTKSKLNRDPIQVQLKQIRSCHLVLNGGNSGIPASILADQRADFD